MHHRLRSSRFTGVINDRQILGTKQYRWSDITIPSLSGGTVFGGDLRADIHYDPACLTKVFRNGEWQLRAHINPRVPAPMGEDYDFNFRAEFSDGPNWYIKHPLGNRKIYLFKYHFPTVEEGFTMWQSGVSIFQNHPGSQPGNESNPPNLQLELAYPNQLTHATDPYRQTPNGGEIMIINNLRGIRYVAQGVRAQAGATIELAIDMTYGIGNLGIFDVYVNRNLVTFQGTTAVPIPGNLGSTVDVTHIVNPFGGNNKFMPYHHGWKDEARVIENENAGHNSFTMFMGKKLVEITRTPGMSALSMSQIFNEISSSSL